MDLNGATDMTELTCEIHIVSETYEQLKSLTKILPTEFVLFFKDQSDKIGRILKVCPILNPLKI